MPNLRPTDHMHTCESPYCQYTTGGNRAGRPRPFVVQKYKQDIEKYWCDTCCQLGRTGAEIIDKHDDNGNWGGYVAVSGEALRTVRKHEDD